VCVAHWWRDVIGNDPLLAFGTRLLAVEVGLAITLMLAVVFGGAATQWWRERRAVQQARARDVLSRLLIATSPVGRRDIATLQRLPFPVREALVLEFGRTVRGESIDRLARVASAIGLTRRAVHSCASRFWWRRLAGARLLGVLDYNGPALRALLDDPDPTVRSEVLHWAASRADSQVIDSLVARLTDPARLCRFTVRDSLLRLGHPAAVALEKFLERHDPSALADGLLVARGLAQPNLLAPALRLSAHADALVRARAVAVLGTLGGESAAAILVERLHDDDTGVREAAARAIGEVAHWRAASALAERLTDASFPVRREAGLALRRLGSVGVLLLRRARTSNNPFAVDMASQVLDLPESVFHRMAA